MAGVREISNSIIEISFNRKGGKPVTGWDKAWSTFFYYYWSISIKWIMPTVLVWVTWWALKQDVETAYGGYPTWLHILGLSFIVVGFLMVIIPGFFPYKGDTKRKV